MEFAQHETTERETEPGKFEGQYPWVKRAYEVFLDGVMDVYDCGRSYCMAFLAMDRGLRIYLEVPDTVHAVALEIDNQGFVSGRVFRDEKSYRDAIDSAAHSYELACADS